MKLSLQRAIAASIPAVLLASSGLAASANPAPGLMRGPVLFRPFGARPFASTPVVLGGGATLPIPAYLGLSEGGAYEGTGQTSFGVTGSVFGYFGAQAGGLNVEYCATGSGKGKGVFDSVSGTVNIPCANAASMTATTFGFSPPSGSPTQNYPTVTGSDAPLQQSEYYQPSPPPAIGYIATHPSGEPVELPSILGSIAILYHDNALSPSAARITLTDAQVCGIFNGSITTFGALLHKTDSTPIVPVYRSDGSGTSFNFTNHLSAAAGCTGWGANQTFSMADPSLPASAFGAKGNSGIIAEVNAQNGAIGYAEAGYVTNMPTGKGPMNYAKVVNATNGIAYDPFAGLPPAATKISSSNLLTNVVVNQTLAGQGVATTSPLTGVRSGSCVKVVAPSAYAKPTIGYPLVAVTYLLFNSVGNGSAGASGLRLLVKDLTTPGLFKNPNNPNAPIQTVDEAAPNKTGTTGYSSLSTTFTSILQGTANACIGV